MDVVRDLREPVIIAADEGCGVPRGRDFSVQGVLRLGIYSHLAWGQVPGELLIHTRNRWPVIHRVWLPRRDVDEATAILCRCVRVRDAWNRVLEPGVSPARGPTRRSPPPSSSSTATVPSSSTCGPCSFSSWWPVAHELVRHPLPPRAPTDRPTGQTGALHADGLLVPKAVRHLDFSASPIKPGDEDLEIVAKLPRLELLDLAGAPVTDAGLVRLEKMTFSQGTFSSRTRVTKEGVNRLQRALPQATICH